MYVMAIDQGTTGSTVIILDKNGQVRGKSNREFRQIFPKPGWVEHNPEDIWQSVVTAKEAALVAAGIKINDVSAVGITNQRETSVVWNKKTGAPLGNALVWQDRRTSEICEKLKKQGKEILFRTKTGLVLDPYFSGTKLSWLFKENPSWRKLAAQGVLAFGTIDSFLLYRLTGGRVHATDVSNASRTLLMDLKTLQWDSSLCKILGVPMEILPEIKPSIGFFGETGGENGSASAWTKEFGKGIPISGIAGDQQAALFGQACFNKGEAKCTYGTGSFLLLNTGKKPVASRSGCLTTVAWKWGKETTYAIEGSAFVCGAAVQWLRDGLKIIKSSGEIEALAQTVSDCAGVQFVPALTGLGAPYWDAEARGTISGLTRGATAGHLARATLEGMALQNVGLLKAMEKDLKSKVKTLKVDGGASANNLLMQMQSDFFGVNCTRPKMIETTSAGAAFMAGLGAGVWKSYKEIKEIWKKDVEFSPRLTSKARASRWFSWEKAVEQARHG